MGLYQKLFTLLRKNNMQVEEPENYEKFLEIIQKKIIDRAKEVDFLMTTMFLLRKEISSGEENI